MGFGEKGEEEEEVVKVKTWGNKKKSKVKKTSSSTTTSRGCCWVRLRLISISSCISSRSKVDTSAAATGSGTTTAAHYDYQSFALACFSLQLIVLLLLFQTGVDAFEENKSASGTSKDQPAGTIVPSTTTSNAESQSSTSKFEEELKVSSRLRKFAFNDLKLATRNFRPESLLGEGGFGCVFKGWIEENGTAPVRPGTGLTVAVKTLNHDGLQGHKEWLAEVSFLGDIVHPNLVKLVGYCIEDDQRLLVYEFMPRGSLENHLFRRSIPLPWSIRMKIALGAAKGLAFLHEEAERPVIYRDFKTSNILLDADYNAKLSDFGLAKDGPEGDKTHVSTRVMGTYGYAAPEYVMTVPFRLVKMMSFVRKFWSGHLTSRSDVYSFGVVLLEMLSGRRSMDKNRPNGEHNLVEWARPHLGERRRFYRLIDPRLEGHFSIKGAQKAAQLAAHCLSRDPKARPLMSEVVEALKPLPNLKDMASSSYYFQTMQSERSSPSPNARSGVRFARNGQRSLSIPNGSHASPYHYQFPHPSPKTKGKA
ncbi:hypothetical protein ACFE04_022991 [Oxalis oulophora]